MLISKSGQRAVWYSMYSGTTSRASFQITNMMVTASRKRAEEEERNRGREEEEGNEEEDQRIESMDQLMSRIIHFTSEEMKPN